MSKESLALPETRSWRDIPQQVKPRAMSREGKRRLSLKMFRVCAGLAAGSLVCWGGWEVAMVLRDPAALPDEARSDKIKSLVLATDGVLDKQWLTRTLALPARTTLMEVDLMALRARLMADPQVMSATLTRNFPDTLSVRLSERTPIVRVAPQADPSATGPLLVARDGVVYQGSGYDPAMIETLPWLDGAKIEAKSGRFQPVMGMAAVADLLGSAKLEAEALYRTWDVVSVARLASDRVVEVHTRTGAKVIFGTAEDYLRQIARLDLLLDSSNDPSRPISTVDLSLGAQVPVTYGKATPMLTDRPAPRAVPVGPGPGPVISFPSLSTLQPEGRRGL